MTTMSFSLLDNLARLVDTVAPRRCAGCDTRSPEILCEVCVDIALALPVPPPRPARYGVCRAALPWQPPARGAIHAAKYRGCRRALHVLAAVAAENPAPAGLGGGAPEAVCRCRSARAGAGFAATTRPRSPPPRSAPP